MQIMPYDEILAGRVRRFLANQPKQVAEKKMMGGLTFMVDDKMCIGILRDDLMARIAPEEYENALLKEGCRPMDFTGKPMKGFIFVTSRVIDTDQKLKYWVDLALAFNDRAKRSKK